METRAVQINIAVKDHQGRPIRGLRKEDFTVTDDGRRREIQMFSSEDEPVTVAAPVKLAPNVFSNRFRTADSNRRITAILLDAVSTPFRAPGLRSRAGDPRGEEYDRRRERRALRA